MPENSVISKNIKAYRKEHGESQEDFAANCGLSTDSISLIEREKTDPMLSSLKSISAYMGCRTYQLMLIEDE